MASGVDTHTHTYFGSMKVISRNQAHVGLHAPGLKSEIDNICLLMHYIDLMITDFYH